MKHLFLANAYAELKLIEFTFTWRLLEVVISSHQETAGSFHVYKKRRMIKLYCWTKTAQCTRGQGRESNEGTEG